MKTKLTSGAEIDFLTADELRQVLREQAQDLREVDPTEIRADDQGITDAAGALTLSVYKVPSGRRFKLTRMIVLADGFTPAAPFQAAGAYLLVRRSGGQVVDFLPLTVASGGGLPAKGSDSISQAADFVNGETVDIQLVAGPASTNVSVFIQGSLQPRIPISVVSV